MLARVETAGAGLLRRDLTVPVRQGCRHNRVATVSPSGTTYELVFKHKRLPALHGPRGIDIRIRSNSDCSQGLCGLPAARCLAAPPRRASLEDPQQFAGLVVFLNSGTPI